MLIQSSGAPSCRSLHCTDDGTRRRINDLAAAARSSLVTSVGVQASSWTLFRGAIFGRDSALVGIDLVERDPALVRTIIASLMFCQGLRDDEQTYEEPGKIHHEYRARSLGGELVDDESLRRMEHLQRKLGFPLTDEFITYLSVDATPLFVRLVAEHVDRVGESFLDEQHPHRTGGYRSVRAAVSLALEWVARQLERSPLGLVEAQPNRWGHWQVLRDGSIAYLHTDGSRVNHRQLQAMLEVQGHAYDALVAGARLVPTSADRWRHLARDLQRQTLTHFWDAEHATFMAAIDRSDDEQLRPVRTTSSAIADLLDTTMLWDLPRDWSTPRLVGSIARQLMSDEFLTPVGIRMRGRQHHGLVPHVDYQGSLVSWPVITNLFARGLRRYGLPTLAQEMERRLLAGVLFTGQFVEFHFVSYDGAVHALPHEPLPRAHAGQTLMGTNLPEKTQAWTWSAALRAAHALCGFQEVSPWQQVLANDLMPRAIDEPRHWPVAIDLEQGRAWEQSFVAQSH